MLRSTSDLKNYVVGGTDIEIDHANDFFIFDETCILRYIVVETGECLPSREVLISRIAVEPPNQADRIIPVSIAHKPVKNRPGIDIDLPISRQHEMRYTEYCGYPYGWGSTLVWGVGPYPTVVMLGCSGYSPPSAARTQEGGARRSPHDSAALLDRRQELQICAHHCFPPYREGGLMREHRISRV